MQRIIVSKAFNILSSVKTIEKEIKHRNNVFQQLRLQFQKKKKDLKSSSRELF